MSAIIKIVRKLVIFIVFFLFTACSTIAQNYKACDTVDVLSEGSWYPSSVLEVKQGLYKIHYNNQHNSFDTWVTMNQISPDEVIANQKAITEEAAISPISGEINEDLPEIIGTSWSLLCIYEKGTQPKNLRNFPEYLFCKNGRWELHSLTNSAGQMGTYTIKGNKLVTVQDGADKLTGNYTITWNATEKYLELNDGKLIFRLRYRTKTKC